MFRRYLLMLLVLFIIGWLSYPSKEPNYITSLPDIAFTLPDGTPTSLSQFKGKTTLIHFWATWCPPCLPEIPELVELAKQHPDELTIIAFSADTKKETIERFMSQKFGELPPNFISIWDKDMTLAREKFYSFNFPETFILGCDGALRDKHIGAVHGWGKKIEPHLAACTGSD